jgi:hypothetical protein
MVKNRLTKAFPCHAKAVSKPLRLPVLAFRAMAASPAVARVHHPCWTLPRSRHIVAVGGGRATEGLFMKQVFLSGHGGWTPKQGYTNVPKGCKINFYTNFAKNLITGMEYQILDGSYTNIDRTINEYMQCPNMLLSGQDKSWTDKSKERLKNRNDIDWALITPPEKGRHMLSSIFAYFETKSEAVEFHWLACQTLQLKQVGGRAHGLNAGDFAHDPSQPAQFRITTTGNGGTVYTWI